MDIYKGLEDIERTRKLTDEEKAELKRYQKLASACTPLAKGMKVYLNLAEAEVAKHYNFVKSVDMDSMESYKQA